jgi:hypothetical protein
MKQNIDKCLAEYSTNELIKFHANLNAIFLCCTEDFHLLPLLMNVTFALAARKESIAKRYLDEVNKMLAQAANIKYLL